MDDHADRAAIERILASEDATWTAGDPAGFSANLTDDAAFTNIVGMFSVGRAPFEAQHAQIFATIYRGSRLEQRIERIAFVRPDVAIVGTVTSVFGFDALPPGVAAADGVLRTRLEQVMVREGAEWKVAAFHNVAISPHLPA